MPEQGEIPEGYVPVYISANRRYLQEVRSRGIKAKGRKQGTDPEVEAIFGEVGREMGIGFDRGACIFAYPSPGQEGSIVSFDPERDVLLEVMVDPRSALVASADYFTEASTRFRSGFGEEEARAWAKSYWETAQTLKEYREQGHTGDPDDITGLPYPEVLVREDIPPTRIRVIEAPRVQQTGPTL